MACGCKKEIKVFVFAAWLEDPSFRILPFARLEPIRTAAQAEKVMYMEGGEAIRTAVQAEKVMYIEGGEAIRTAVQAKKVMYMEGGEAIRTAVQAEKVMYIEGGDAIRPYSRDPTVSIINFHQSL